MGEKDYKQAVFRQPHTSVSNIGRLLIVHPKDLCEADNNIATEKRPLNSFYGRIKGMRLKIVPKFIPKGMDRKRLSFSRFYRRKKAKDRRADEEERNERGRRSLGSPSRAVESKRYDDQDSSTYVDEVNSPRASTVHRRTSGAERRVSSVERRVSSAESRASKPIALPSPGPASPPSATVQSPPTTSTAPRGSVASSRESISETPVSILKPPGCSSERSHSVSFSVDAYVDVVSPRPVEAFKKPSQEEGMQLRRAAYRTRLYAQEHGESDIPDDLMIFTPPAMRGKLDKMMGLDTDEQDQPKSMKDKVLGIFRKR